MLIDNIDTVSLNGSQEVVIAVEQESFRSFLRGESDDPAQVITRLEERFLAEKENSQR